MTWIVEGRTREGRRVVYTGRAGEGWTSYEAPEAFPYGCEGVAEWKANLFNRMTPIHGIEFRPKEVHG